MIIDTSGMPPVLARRFEELARAIQAAGGAPLTSRGFISSGAGRMRGLRLDMHAARSMLSQVQAPTAVGQILVCTKSAGEPDYRWVRLDPPSYNAVLVFDYVDIGGNAYFNGDGIIKWAEIVTDCP